MSDGAHGDKTPHPYYLLPTPTTPESISIPTFAYNLTGNVPHYTVNVYALPMSLGLMDLFWTHIVNTYSEL